MNPSQQTKESIWTREYVVTSFLASHQKRIGLSGILSLLQDMAWAHATHLGIGHEESMREQKAWVLARQLLSMVNWPQWEDRIEIRTWVRPLEGIFATRDFEIWCNNNMIGQSTTSWIPMDLRTRRPTKIRPSTEKGFYRLDGRIPLDTSKIELRDAVENLSQFQARTSDLDMNGHVNNIRYAQWIMDSVPRDSLLWNKLESYEVNFLAETQYLDTVLIQTASIAVEDKSTVESYFHGRREADQKIVFTARLLSRALSHQVPINRSPLSTL